MCACSSRDEPIDFFKESLDLRVPPRARVVDIGPTPREFAILREVVDAIRLVGGLLVGGGVVAALVLATGGGAPLRAGGLVMGLVVIPGLLYLAASAGLARRRCWAWFMSLVVTLLLLFTLLGVCAYFAAFTDEPRQRGFAFPAAVYALIPVLILRYMLRALPVVRDAELLVRKGFEVLPPADPATDAPPQAVRVLKPGPRPDDASPAPTTPAPQPTTTPRRS